MSKQSMSKQKKESLSLSLIKLFLAVSIIVSAGALAGSIGYLISHPGLFTDPGQIIALFPKAEVNSVEISTDSKSILNAETKEVVLPMYIAKKYLKASGYEYNPDTFQITDAKYAGECFLSASLSHGKDKIAFSTGCLAGDVPYPWIGVYSIPKCSTEAYCDIVRPEQVQFLAAGSGQNFIWSKDDQAITYEADLGLSGPTETRTIDAVTGEILKMENSPITNAETKDWKTYSNEKYGFEVKYPKDWNLAGISENPFNVTIWEEDGFNKDNIQVVEGVFRFASQGSIEKNIEYLKSKEGVKEEFNKFKEFLIVGGKGFYWINSTPGGSSPSVYLVGKNQIFLMNYNIYNSPEDSFLRAEKIFKFNKIISTFKFIEPER